MTRRIEILQKGYESYLFQSHVPALPVHVDSHKEIACDFDWESVPASQEIRVVRREFPRPFFPRAKSADFARQAHAFMREPWHLEEDIWELRPGNNRVLYFYHRDDTYVLLHQFRKKTQKTPRREIEKAKSERDDWIARKGR